MLVLRLSESFALAQRANGDMRKPGPSSPSWLPCMVLAGPGELPSGEDDPGPLGPRPAQ